MTNTQPGIHSANNAPEPVQPQQMDIAISPPQFLSSYQTLILIRYLQDIKNVPAEHFRQAARELGLTDHFAGPLKEDTDNPVPRTPIPQEAITAVLIRTYFNTDLPEPTVPQNPPPSPRPPDLPHPNTWPKNFKFFPPDYQAAAIARGFDPDKAI